MNKKPLSDEIKEQNNRGVLLILTGPTGAGKDTLFTKLQENNPSIIKIITTTSRSMRANEKEGDPYYFVSRDEFEKLIATHAFFEWVEFRSALMGTQKKTLEDALGKGVDVIWRIEAKGVKNIKEKVKALYPRCVFVYLVAPTIAMMEQRVREAEGEEGFQKRWNPSLVSWEMEQYDDCDYVVCNEDGLLDIAAYQVQAIMEAKRREIQRIGS